VGMLKRENEALKQRLEPLAEVLTLLQTASADLAQVIFLKLRHGDAATVLNFIKGAVPDSRLSEQTAARAALPHVQSNLELELLVRHPVAYPTVGTATDRKTSIGRSGQVQTWLQPPSGSSSSSSLLKLEDSSFPPINKSDDSDTFTDAHSPAGESSFLNRPAKRRMLDESGVLHKPVGPALPPTFVDPLLQNIDIRFWTNVSVTNELAAGAISLYLQTGHPILGLFDSQLFLSSLVACNTEFCSRFLVNSLLAYATVSFDLDFALLIRAPTLLISTTASLQFSRSGCSCQKLRVGARS